MARDTGGWRVEIHVALMCCFIHEARPEVCRRFVLAGSCCRDMREDYVDRTGRCIRWRSDERR